MARGKCPGLPSRWFGSFRLYRDGTYGREFPAGKRVAWWYCADCRVAPSALPDCLSARLPGSLAEAVASFAEDHVIHAAVVWGRGRRFQLPALGSPGVLLVRECLTVFRGLEPILLLGVALTVGAFRERLEVTVALVELRRLGSAGLAHIPYPVGFDLRRRRVGSQTGPPTANCSTRGARLRRR